MRASPGLGNTECASTRAGRALTRSSGLVEAQATAWANRRTRLQRRPRHVRLALPRRRPRRPHTPGTAERVEGRRLNRPTAASPPAPASPQRARECTRDSSAAAADAPNQGVTAAGAVHVRHRPRRRRRSRLLSPGLGFVHSGHERSFVLDIANLSPTGHCHPCRLRRGRPATRTSPPEHPPRPARPHQTRVDFLDRCVQDIKDLLDYEQPERPRRLGRIRRSGPRHPPVRPQHPGNSRPAAITIPRSSGEGGSPMTVIVLTNCPAGLRGFLTRWLLGVLPRSLPSAPPPPASAPSSGLKSASTPIRAVHSSSIKPTQSRATPSRLTTTPGIRSTTKA